MKKLKSIFCVLMCLLTVGVFSACGKDKTPPRKNPNENNPNEMSLSKVLEAVYEKFDGLTKTEYEGTKSFSSKTGNNYTYALYDEVVYEGAYMIKLIAELENLETNVWLQGEESTIQISEGNPSKLDMLYITREKQEYLNNIKIYMVFHKKMQDFAVFPQAYVIYDYNITYDEKTKEMSLECSIEDSSKREFQSVGSTAVYSHFKYSPDNNILQVTSFERLVNVDAVDFDDFNLSYFGARDVIIFDVKYNNKISETLDIPSADLQNRIKIVLSSFYQIELKIFNLDATKKVVAGITDKFIELANAHHIADIVK